MNITTYYSNITKIAGLLRSDKNLASDIANNLLIPVDIGNDITTFFRISEKLTNFDLDVADAIYTIYQNGYGSFTPGQVLRVMSGDDKQTIVAGHNKDEIIDSIERLRSATIEIGCAEEMQSHKIKVAHISESAFLTVERVNDNPKYKMSLRMDYPTVKIEKYADFFMPLYGYAEMLHQFCSFHKELLYNERAVTGLCISNTIENIQIKRYLIRRLEQVRNAKQRILDLEDGVRLQNPLASKKHHVFSEYAAIVYERAPRKVGDISLGMLAALGIIKDDYKSKDSWRHKRHKVHRIVVQILNYYIAIGYVKSYEIIKSKKDERLIRGVKVYLR